MVTEDQAKRLAEAGLYAYNHNIDTSEENYENIISTRKFDDRLNTINNVRKAGLTVCSGGIIGMGEKVEDRVGMLYTLSLLRPQPESVPINALVAVEGTPMEDQPPVPIWDMVRMIATARIVSVMVIVRFLISLIFYLFQQFRFQLLQSFCQRLINHLLSSNHHH
jgi:biotin synthase